MQRFLRTELLLGKECLEKLKSKKVTVVGLGAVGSYVIEGLARSGIQHFKIIDFDQISLSNINRQLYALQSTIGKKKVDVARERILEINPYCTITKSELFAHKETMEEILDNQPDIVIDAIDSLNSKVELLYAAHSKNIPVISSMGAALKTDPAQIKTADLFETNHCHLARFVRKKLKRRGVQQGIQCVYSTEQVNQSAIGRAEQVTDEQEYQKARSRPALGSLTTITGIFGLTIANLALKLLISEGTELDKKISQ